MFISISCFGSGDLILATWQFFLGWGFTAFLPPALCCYLLMATLLSLLPQESLFRSAVSSVPSTPTQLCSFYCHLPMFQTSASLLACHHLTRPAFFLAPLASLPEWVNNNSNHLQPGGISGPLFLLMYPTFVLSPWKIHKKWERQRHLWPCLLLFHICLAFMFYYLVPAPWHLPPGLVLVFHITHPVPSWPARIYPSPHASLSH